jgi:hypothetical protein
VFPRCDCDVTASSITVFRAGTPPWHPGCPRDVDPRWVAPANCRSIQGVPCREPRGFFYGVPSRVHNGDIQDVPGIWTRDAPSQQTVGPSKVFRTVNRTGFHLGKTLVHSGCPGRVHPGFTNSFHSGCPEGFPTGYTSSFHSGCPEGFPTRYTSSFHSGCPGGVPAGYTLGPSRHEVDTRLRVRASVWVGVFVRLAIRLALCVGVGDLSTSVHSR